MASANLDLVRSICANWERGDYSSTTWAHPDIEYTAVGGLEPGSWRGLADMAEATRDQMSAWKDFRIEVEEYRELDDKRILAVWEFKGRGKASGVEVSLMQATGAYLFEINGGRVTSLAYYIDPGRALADLGLTQ